MQSIKFAPTSRGRVRPSQFETPSSVKSTVQHRRIPKQNRSFHLQRSRRYCDIDE